MNLYQALTTGSVSCDENGNTIAHPPNSIMLHASRALKEAETIAASNNQLIQQFQIRLEQEVDENIRLRSEIERLNTLLEKKDVVVEAVAPVVETVEEPTDATGTN